MTGFNRIKEIVDISYDQGKNNYAPFRKVPAIATTQFLWHDLSGSPGNPKPNFYATAEMTAATLDGTYGLFHEGGGKVTTDGFKFLHKMHIFSANSIFAPSHLMMCDYLIYYPLIDMDDTSVQSFNNYEDNPSIPSLPRYSDGMGVQAFLVATNPYVGGARFQITYTNERGQTGRKSQWMTTNTATYIGTIVTSGVGAALNHPFILLQSGDNGIRSVQSIEFETPNGGLATLVLCRPIANIDIYENTALTEVDFILERETLPKIYDGAYLNFIYAPNGSAASVPIIGSLTTIWR